MTYLFYDNNSKAKQKSRKLKGCKRKKSECNTCTRSSALGILEQTRRRLIKFTCEQ